MGKTATITVRVSSEIKDAARLRAQRLGISLSTLVENDLRRFVNGHPIIIDDESLVPSERLLASIAEATEDLAAGNLPSVPADQIGEYLDRQIQVAE